MYTFDKNNKKNFKFILNYLNILYVEDEKNIRENIEKTLRLMVSNVFSCENIEEAKKIIENERIDLIISDINLPGQNGLDFVEMLRECNNITPVILLSAYTQKDYLLKATRLKLVDYLVKPINFDELKNCLCRACEEIIEKGLFIINFEEDISYNVLQKKLYSKEEKTIDLTHKEILLLDYLIQNNNRVVTHQEIKDHIWEDIFEASDSALKNLLNKLRKKIGKNSIENISGVGFRIHLG